MQNHNNNNNNKAPQRAYQCFCIETMKTKEDMYEYSNQEFQEIQIMEMVWAIRLTGKA